MELTKLSEIYNQIREWDDDISADMALDCATRLMISNNISSERNKGSGNKEGYRDGPKATEKQIGFLIKLGYKGDTTNLTITEARKLIEQFKDNARN